MGEELLRLHAIVEGRVQGVGFRYFVQEQAASLDLVGWVRNRWDGTVEVTAEGDQLTLSKFLAALQRGPRASSVSNVRTDWQPGVGEFSDFQIHMTSI
jgi:acylphosphatase